MKPGFQGLYPKEEIRDLVIYNLTNVWKYVLVVKKYIIFVSYLMYVFENLTFLQTFHHSFDFQLSLFSLLYFSSNVTMVTYDRVF